MARCIFQGASVANCRIDARDFICLPDGGMENVMGPNRMQLKTAKVRRVRAIQMRAGGATYRDIESALGFRFRASVYGND